MNNGNIYNIRKGKQRRSSFIVLLWIFIIASLAFIQNMNSILDGDESDPGVNLKGDYQLGISTSGISYGIPISTANGNQWQSQIISDTLGGYILTWQDARNGDYNIYAQRINLEGKINWTINGIPICTALGDQGTPQLISDGNGGAIIGWIDNRSGTGLDLYAQKVNSTGQIQWNVDGVPICTAIGNQLDIQLIADGLGGAFCGWFDDRSHPYYYNIYAQRINSNGQINWTKYGVPIYTGYADVNHALELISDDFGGVIIGWEGILGIYCQRLNTTGHVLWAPEGIAIQYDALSPSIVNDGSGTGSFIVSWIDYRYDSFYDIFAQKVNSSGDSLWLSGGEEICVIPGPNYYPNLIPDGSGGAIISWEDHRRSHGDSDIYAQRINNEGQINWTADGIPICTVEGDQKDIRMVSDDKSGAILIWEDYRKGYIDVYAQRITSLGSTIWASNGTAICAMPSIQWYPELVSDGNGGAVITWSDGRNYVDLDIYIQKINSTGQLYWFSEYLDESSTIPGFDFSVMGLIMLISIFSISIILIKRNDFRKKEINE